MKTILVPTDFSKTALNATEYAIELAKSTNSKVILFHVFDVPVTVTDIPVVINSFDDYEKSKKKQLKSHIVKLTEKHGTEVSISSVLRPGFLSDELIELIEDMKIDLVVMGITGAGKAAELLIGSNATRVIKDVTCPVITVHDDIKFKSINKIAFACDYEGIEESQGVDKVIDFVKLFEAKLLLINIIDEEQKGSLKKEISGALLEHVFDKQNHTTSFRKSEDVTEGINRFVDHHNIDLLIMLPKKHTLFSRLFHESNTKKMAFHTHVPLLTIHN